MLKTGEVQWAKWDLFTLLCHNFGFISLTTFWKKYWKLQMLNVKTGQVINYKCWTTLHILIFVKIHLGFSFHYGDICQGFFNIWNCLRMVFTEKCLYLLHLDNKKMFLVVVVECTDGYPEDVEDWLCLACTICCFEINTLWCSC